jgi:hypothetical protein
MADEQLQHGPGAYPLGEMLGTAVWFRDLVKGGGPWNYKRYKGVRCPEHEHFGNFNW